MKVIIWVFAFIVGFFISFLIALLTGFMLGALPLWLIICFIAQKLCKLWDKRQMKKNAHDNGGEL